MKRQTILFALLALLLPALVAAAADTAPVSVNDAFVQALPPAARNTSAYMNITNTSGEVLVLTGASTAAAGSVMIHRSSSENGMMSMEHVMAVEIPAGASVALEPGGLHLMLVDLRAPLSPGSSVELTLRFESGAEYSLSLPVRRLQAP